MSMSLAPAEVGAKIAKWYSCIRKRDVEQAKLLKNEIELMLDRMKDDEKVISYYQLVNFRHQLLLETIQKNEVDANQDDLAGIQTLSDSYLNFMYYFMSGQDEFYLGRYKSAIRLYKVAEQLLESVPDESERAEFYHRLGIGYYRIDQYTFAVSYLEQALEFFAKRSEYEERALNTKLILAAISTELTRYDEAEFIYQEILKGAQDKYPVTHALILRSLGLNRVRQNRLEEAKMFLMDALYISEHSESVVGSKTKYNLANILLRLDNSVHSRTLLDEAEKEVKRLRLTDYIAKCKISRGLYIKHDPALVEEGIQELKAGEYYFDCSEVAEEIANYYDNKGDSQNALKYMRLALQMRINQSCVGVDQE